MPEANSSASTLLGEYSLALVALALILLIYVIGLRPIELLIELDKLDDRLSITPALGLKEGWLVSGEAARELFSDCQELKKSKSSSLESKSLYLLFGDAKDKESFRELRLADLSLTTRLELYTKFLGLRLNLLLKKQALLLWLLFATLLDCYINKELKSLKGALAEPYLFKLSKYLGIVAIAINLIIYFYVFAAEYYLFWQGLGLLLLLSALWCFCYTGVFVRKQEP